METDEISQSGMVSIMEQNETEKHRQIMSAAAARFAKQGYKKTTIDEIVSGAGISKGLFYHYFKNKKDLYIHLYISYVDILSHSIRENVDITETDLFRRLKQITHIRIDFVTKYPNLWGFLYSAYYEEHPDIVPLIKEKNEKLLQESYAGSAANIDWTKLKKGLSPDKAIEIVTWIAEGFVRKAATNNLTLNPEIYYQFDEYIECLKTGMYEDEKR